MTTDDAELEPITQTEVAETKPKKKSKTVGEYFHILFPKGEEGLKAKQILTGVAQLTTFAENAIWMLWRKHDPVTSIWVAETQADLNAQNRPIIEQNRAIRLANKNLPENKQKELLPYVRWPQLPEYKLSSVAEGETPTKIAGAICKGLYSYVYDAVANHVNKFYLKKRFQYLRFDERLPTAKDLRIRFRERAVQVRRNPNNPDWFQLGLSFRKDEILWADIKTGGKSESTIKWLSNLSDGKVPMYGGEYSLSGGTVSSRKKRGKLVWQVALARRRYDGEREIVDPMSGRFLLVWAPLDQEVFLWCEVKNPDISNNGRPWKIPVESNDLIRSKLRAEELRRTMGRNYNQSSGDHEWRGSGAHGHGRKRAIKGKIGSRYERQVNNWIEVRSAAIVRFALESKCGLIKLEKLSNRDPQKLRLGSFDYSRLMTRIKQKAASARIKVSLFDDLESIKDAEFGGGLDIDAMSV